MQKHQHNDAMVESELVQSLIKERRRERLWKNIRFFISITVFLIMSSVVFKQVTHRVIEDGDKKGYVALIRLNGTIAPGESFSAEEVIPLLKDAFRDKNSKGIILAINSGGGTPVQASIIHDAIIGLKNKYHKKVVVVGEDLLASGAYFVAVAADKIFVNPNTITGSIGVIMKGFGLPELMKKYGIERRVYTAGMNKDRLDPFLPQNPQDLIKVQSVIKEVHENFIQSVEQGRKGKLHGDNAELFSGDFWSGQTAVKLGLVDGLGNLSDVMDSEFQVTHYKDYSQEDSVLKSLVGRLGASFGAALANDEVKLLEKI